MTDRVRIDMRQVAVPVREELERRARGLGLSLPAYFRMLVIAAAQERA